MGFIWIAFDKRKQGLHDKIAHTLVVDSTFAKQLREDKSTMLNNLRIIYIISMILVLCMVLYKGIHTHNTLEQKLLSTNLHDRHTVFAQHIEKYIWHKYARHNLYDYLDQAVKTNDWDADGDGASLFHAFLNNCVKYSATLPIVSLNISHPQGTRFFRFNNSRVTNSSNDSLYKRFFKEDIHETYAQLKEQALSSDKSIYHIASNTDLIEKKSKETLHDRTIFISYFPIYYKNQKLIVEITSDITDNWNTILYINYAGIALTICIVLIIYLLIAFISYRITKIIDKQHEINIKLAEAKAKAEADNKAKSQFLANITHELRTPLNAIIGFSEIIKNEALGTINNLTYKDYVNDIYNSGTHLLSLINDILDFSKAEAQKLVVENTPVNLNKVALGSIKLMKERAANNQVMLKFQSSQDDVIVLGDKKRLRQVFLNLLSNAIKFTPESGDVTVDISINNNKAIMKVIDTGIGISPKDISKTLASFGQVDSELSRKYEGTGLGLPLTKKLVELMGGKFEMISEKGLGTTIISIFNLSTEHHAQMQRTNAEKNDQTNNTSSADTALPAATTNDSQGNNNA